MFDRFVGLALKGLRFLKTTLDLVKLGIIKTGWTARIIENNVNEIYLQPSKCSYATLTANFIPSQASVSFLLCPKIIIDSLIFSGDIQRDCKPQIGQEA